MSQNSRNMSRRDEDINIVGNNVDTLNHERGGGAKKPGDMKRIELSGDGENG